jgi:hypothetical protein
MKYISLVAVLFFSAAAFAQSPQAWDAKTIVWQDIDRDGTKWSVLEGDKNAVGKAFTYAFFIPAGYWEHHWHTQDARVYDKKLGIADQRLGNAKALPHATGEAG